VQRWLFRKEIESITTRQVYWIDECGVVHRLYNEYGWAPRGEKIYEDISGSRRGRTGVLAAYDGEKLVAPITFEGTCNSEKFNEWLEKDLFPKIKEGSVCVLDNATFHKTKKSLELADKFSIELIFLPTYSPDLNPIEHKWPQLKKIARKTLPSSENKALAVANAVLMLCQ
jgi:transposase